MTFSLAPFVEVMEESGMQNSGKKQERRDAGPNLTEVGVKWCEGASKHRTSSQAR